MKLYNLHFDGSQKASQAGFPRSTLLRFRLGADKGEARTFGYTIPGSMPSFSKPDLTQEFYQVGATSATLMKVRIICYGCRKIVFFNLNTGA